MSAPSQAPFTEWVLERLPGVEVLAGEDGRALAAEAGGLYPIPGLDAPELLRLLSWVDGHRTVADVLRLAEEFLPADAEEVLRALVGRLLRRVGGDGGTASVGRDLGALAGALALPPRQRLRQPAGRSVAVLGGGTAGYLAALALRREFPNIPVTVVESPDVPVIGVGEATTPLLPAFLHGTLGLDIGGFFREVRPTFKLGIRFLWGRPAPYAFNYPFAAGRLEDALAHDGHLDGYCLPSRLMNTGKGPLVRFGEGRLGWMPYPFAYHVDNRRFVAYLQGVAEASGIERLRRHVVDVDKEDRGDPDGPTVTALVDAAGERLVFDFFVDASGFACRLLGGELGVSFSSFADSLPTDSALAFDTPREGPPTPYTEAATLDSGWAWCLPQPESDHRGYVFSSAHASPEAAEAEVRRLFPQMGDPRLLRFESGRRHQAWRSNVFALGNAYGFVEPLESTALHMVVASIHLLVEHLPAAPWEPASRRQVNEHLGGFWDHLRDFLALHFRFNERLDTPFWRTCRSRVDLGGAREALALYQERGNLSSQPHLLRFDSLWGDFGRDVLLRGQGVPAPPPRPRLSRKRWQSLQDKMTAVVEAALPVEEALAAVEREPELLRRLAARAPWLQDSAVGGFSRW